MRRSTPEPPARPDPKLEPLEPRILLSADVGLIPDEGLALVALAPELAVPQVEIHDEVLARESSDPDPSSEPDPEPPNSQGDVEQGDPGRADQALADLVWAESTEADVLAREVEASQLVVIDGRVPEIDSLLASLLESTADLDGPTGEAGDIAERLEARGIGVVVLDTTRDGVDQLGEILEAFQGVSALHLVSHGSAGQLQLGDGDVTAETLEARAQTIEAVGRALAGGADILLYGCHVADGEVGIEFVSALAKSTGADVAASNDATGGAGFGDWDLEVATGAIDTSVIMADGYAAALDTTPITGDGDDTFVVTYDGTGGEWTVQVNGADSANSPFASPTSTGPADPAIIEINTGGSGTVDIQSVDPAFTGTIRIIGTANADDISVIGLASNFAGRVEIEGGDSGDTITLSGIGGGFTGTIEVDAGDGGDDIIVSDVGVGFAGTFEFKGGLGDDTYQIIPDEWGTLRIDEADGDGTDTLSFADDLGVDRVAAFSAGSSIVYVNADQKVERLEGLTLDATALEAGIASLVDWARALSTTDDLGAQLAGLTGTADIGIGTAMDLADVFEQLRVLVATGDDSLTAADLYDLLESFSVSGVAYTGSGVVSEEFDPTIAANAEFVFHFVLDDVTDTIGSTTDDDKKITGETTLAGLVTEINQKLAVSDVAGQVRAVEVGAGAARRLAFVVDDDTSKSFSVTGGTAATASVGFGLLSGLSTDSLDTRLKGLGELTASLSGLRVDFDLVAGTPTVGFRFALGAERTSEFTIDLGDAAEEIDLEFGGNATLELASRFDADMVLRLKGALDGGPEFSVAVDDPRLSAQVMNAGGTGSTSNVLEEGDAVEASIGFLGAEVDQANQPTDPQSKIDLKLSYQTTGFGWLDLTEGELDTEAGDSNALATRVQQLTGPALPSATHTIEDVFDVRLAIGITPFAGFTADSDPFGVEVITKTAKALDGRSAIDAAALAPLDPVKNFSKLDPTTYIALLGQIRGGLDAIRSSELFDAVDIPFVQGGLDKVADLADAFGDAILFDDGDDGVDSRDDTVLVTRLNEALEVKRLDSLVQFRVKLETDDTTGDVTKKLELVAVSDTVEGVKLTGADELKFEDPVGAANTRELTSGVIVAADVIGQAIDFEIDVYLRGDATNRNATVELATSVTDQIAKIGNDVAKLLDESNSATFSTAQELTDRLIELFFPDLADETPFRWKDQQLTFTLEFNADLIDIELPVDFDIDLGPVGNVGIAEGSTITVGGDVGFSLTLGLNLGDLSAKGVKVETELIDLQGVDEIGDVIRLTPSIMADREPGDAVNDDEGQTDEIEVEETRMDAPGELAFGASQSHAVIAESLINRVMNLTSPDQTSIHINGPGQTSLETAHGRTAPLRLTETEDFTAFTDEDDATGYSVEAFTFDVRIDDESGPISIFGTEFTVEIATKKYYVGTTGAAKQKLLADVEKAIIDAQARRFDSTIERETGDWLADGFGAGDKIRIVGSGANDGIHVIKSLTEKVITLEGDLAEQVTIDMSPPALADAPDLEIVGPGRIRYTEAAAGSWDIELGERILLSGTQGNDGAYLVTRVIDGQVGSGMTASQGTDNVLVVSDFFETTDDVGADTEPASEAIRVSSNGAPVRVDPETTGDATFDLVLEIEGALETISVVVSSDGMMDAEGGGREEGAASDLSNNRNLSDLSADVQNAIDEAIDKRIDELVAAEADELAQDGIRLRAPEVSVSLDGTRLVLSLKTAAQVSDDPTLTFTKTSSTEVTVVRTPGDGAQGLFELDGFVQGQRVLVAGADGYEGEYIVDAVSLATIFLRRVEGTISATAPAVADSAVITETFSLGGTNETTRQVLGFGEDDTSTLAASLADLVVFTANATDDSGFVEIVLDGAETVGDVIDRINDALGDESVLATIGLNDPADATGLDLTQDASLATTYDSLFRVETINGSTSAVRLGILGADARSDENLDGEITQEDGDGLIEGAAIGGGSLFDRFYLEDVRLELALEMETPQGIEFYGDFGFFEVSAKAGGDITAVASIGLNDPIADTNPVLEGHITITDLYETFRDFDLLKKMIDPRESFEFGGATVDDQSGDLVFSDEGDKGRITRSGTGSWAEDRFKVNQKFTLVDADGKRDTFQILDIVDLEGTDQSVLHLDKVIDGFTDDAEATSGKVEIESALATLTIGDLELPFGLENLAPTIGLDPDARIVATLLDVGNPFFDEVEATVANPLTFSAANILLLGLGDELDDDVVAGDTVKIEYRDAQDALVVASVVIKTIADEGAGKKITLENDAVDSTDGLTIEKLTFAKPVVYEIDTPDFGAALDFSEIGFEQILDGLLALADFLGQFEEFEFLNEDMPLVGVSVNDLLGYADQFRDMVNEIKADPAGSFQRLEAEIEGLLGIDDGVGPGRDPFDIELDFVTETRAGEDHQMAKLTFVVGAGFRETLGVEFDVGEQGVLAGSADLEAYGGIDLTLAIGMDLSTTKVHGVEDMTVDLVHDEASGGDLIRRTAGSFADDGFMVGQTIDIDGVSGSFEVVSISESGLDMVLDGELASGVASTATIKAEKVVGRRSISIYEETGISAQLTGKADDLSFRAALGPLGIFILEDDPEVTAIEIGGMINDEDTNGDGFTNDLDDKKIFKADIKLSEDDSVVRKLISEIGFDDFDVQVDAGIHAELPVSFPTDSILQGQIDFDAGISMKRGEDGGFQLETTGPELQAFDENGDETTVGELFNISQMLDLGQLSLFDNVFLAIDGIDFFLGGVQDVLDGEVFGIELPLIGDSLSEGAGFIAELRDGFLADLREGVEEAEDFAADLSDPEKNILSKLLFDVLVDTGLLLVELEDGSVIKATKAGLDAGLFKLSDAVSLSGGENGLPDLTASIDDVTAWLKDSESEIKWNMKLGQSLLDVDTDLDIDLGIPGLGFEAEGPLGLKIGWDLDFGFGLNLDEGFFLDIAPEDGTELEVNVDVTLPDRLAGQLAFLQLDAVNDGSFLGATFAVDIFNKDDPAPGNDGTTSTEADTRLSFTELGKLRLRAEVEAQALASFDMLLALNSDLIPSAPSVFPTVGADFILDWSIGGHLDAAAGEITVDGKTLERASGDWASDGYKTGQRIILSGFADDSANGQFFIDSVDGTTLNLYTTTGASNVKQTAGIEIDSYQDLTKITGSTITEGLNEVSFRSIELDLGSFISDLIAPILGEIQSVTQPLQPIIDLATMPLPVVSDFAGPTSLIDLAGIFGTVRPEFLKAIADIITLANAIPTEKGEVKIAFGDFIIFNRDDPEFADVDLADPNFDPASIDKNQAQNENLKDFDQQLDSNKNTGGSSSANNKNKDFAKKLKGLEGFSFPFLSNPTELFGLFTGEPITLLGYDMPALDFEFQYSQTIPIYGPLAVGIGGNFGAHIDFAFGFDTEGISQYADSGFRNPLLIFNGLFVSDNPEDVTGAGPDLPELTFKGGFQITAELNVLFARAGAGGGLFAEIFFDLFDPDHDGRVRILEIAENFVTEFEFGSPLLAPLAIFDVSGNLKARLFAFVEINLLFASIYKEFDLVDPITLVDFDLEFQRRPKLASELPDGVLQLNLGQFAGQRLNGPLEDGDEHFEVRSHADGSGRVQVRAFGLDPVAEAWQTYDRPTAIIGLGGEGNDVIDLSGVTAAGIRFELEGGDGNDVLIAGSGDNVGLLKNVLKGGTGEDVIVGSGGRDVIHGNEGSDVIDGGGGDDVIFGDGGRIVVGEGRVTRVDLEVVPSQSVIARDDGVSWQQDGFKSGQIVEISGSTLFVDENDTGNDGFYKVVLDDEADTSVLRLTGLEGEAIELGFERTDRLKVEIVASEYERSIQASGSASDGDDVLFGGSGSDFVFGAGGADLIFGGGTSVTGAPAADGLRSWARNVANTAGTTARDLRNSIDGSSVTDGDSGGDVRDLLVGDTGEVRFRLGKIVPTYRDVIETNRGIFFGADEIYGNGGFDLIHGGQGDDEIHGGHHADEIYGELGVDALYGDRGVDVIHGGRGTDVILGGEQGDFLYGDEGNDVIAGEAGEDVIEGNAGSDWLWGGTHDDEVYGGGGFDTLYGGTGADLLDGGAGDDTVYGELGHDVGGHELDAEGNPIPPSDSMPDFLPAFAVDHITPSGTVPGDETYTDTIFVGGGNDFLDGQTGADEYIVDFRGAANQAIVPIRDTGSLGVDRLTVNGTDFDDLFLLRKTQYVDGSATPIAEQFDGFVTSINRDGALERIDYDGIDRIVVNGQQGDDEFAVDDIGGSTELNGGGGRDLFKVGQIYKTPRTIIDANIAIGDYFDTIETTRGWLSNGIDQPMTINAGADDDEIIVLRNLDVLQVNGEEGDDTITVRAFALTEAEVERQKLLSQEEAERLERDETEIVGGAGADLIQYAVNAPVNIDGGDGLDKVSVIGTEFGDDFVITEQGVYGAGLNVNLVNVELLLVDGAEGDDAFFVQSTQDGLITQLFGGLGSDTFDIAGDAPSVVSNDLLGHSGLITHGIETNDALYQGADGDGISVEGISANVADDDEPFVRITQTDGSTRIGEAAGFTDLYYVALTRKPNDDEIVRIDVLAPSLTPEESARGAAKFRLASEFPDPATDAADGSSISLFFDKDNWDTPQWVDIEAIDDNALEGERFGVINHQVTSWQLDRETAYDFSKYESLALPSVTVQIEDNDEADVQIFESDGFTRATEGQSTALDQYDVQLSRAPIGQVEVRIEVTPPEGVDPQVTLSSAHPDAWLDGGILVLQFDATNWDQRQTVSVEAVDDDAREGFHRDFLQHRVEAVADTDALVPYVDQFTPDSKDSSNLSIWPSTSVLLSEAPVQQIGVIGEVDGDRFKIAYGELDPDSLAGHVVRLSSGPADGQARMIVSNDGEWITLDRAFDVEAPVPGEESEPLIGSDFRTSDVTVTIDPARMSEQASDPGAPSITLLADGTVKRSVGSWKDDGFQKGQEIVVLDENGTLLGRYVIETVNRDALQTKRVVEDGGAQDPEVDSAAIADAQVFVAPLDIDRYLINSSTLVFLDEDGRPETRRASHVDAVYEYLHEGFDGRREERIVVEVIDDDTAGVVVTQTGFSTDVTEGGWAQAAGDPPTWKQGAVDTYDIVLTKQPTTTAPGEEAYVDVIVTPEITRTTAGSTAWELKQVLVAEGSILDDAVTSFEDQIVLRFTASNWDVPQTVSVAAIDDAVVDGNDTQAFPEIRHTVSHIQGPLFIDGRGGQGSLEGLTRPVMLEGETSQRVETGTVEGIDENALVVEQSALEAELARRDGFDTLEDFIGRTVELIDATGLGSGPGDGDFTLITGVTDLGDGLIQLDLDPGWGLGDYDPINDGVESERYLFAITDESSNFFVDESIQVDVMRLNDEDNAADFEPGAPNGYGALTAFDPTDYPDTTGLLTADDDPDAFTQGQWNRITGLGMSPDAWIARAERPGGVTFGRLEGVEINLGLGNNHFTVESVPIRNDGVHTYTVINASDGDDVILVSVDAPVNPDAGLPLLRIDAGDGDDVVNGSPDGMAPSTLPIEIHGGYGSDILTGGDGADLIYGDFGETTLVNVVDLDEELALRQLAKRGPAPAPGSSGGDTPVSPVSVPPRVQASIDPNIGTNRVGEGSGDIIRGMAGGDRLFGGAGDDAIAGGEGNDLIFGDYGRVFDETGTRRQVETTDYFAGGDDSLAGGPGNDIMIGGFGRDTLIGEFSTDVLVGDYVRVILEANRATQVVRVAHGPQDVAAASYFGLYAPRTAPGGPDARVSELEAAPAEAPAARSDLEIGDSSARQTAGSGEATKGRHRVRTGDSLWAISERELGDPYRWPEVAKANESLVDDPNVIEPDWVLRLPGSGASDDADLGDVETVRAQLADIDARVDGQRAAWLFSEPGVDGGLPQVGEGPPEATPAPVENAPTGDTLPDQGANDADTEPAELLGAVWAGLTGWQTRVSKQRASKRRWLAFDPMSGRYDAESGDTGRAAGDTHTGRW